MKKTLIGWKIDHVNFFSRVLVIKGTDTNAKLRNGTIVGYCVPNYRIKFDDNSAEYHSPETAFKVAREEYLKSNSTNLNDIDESSRCMNSRLARRGRGREGAGRSLNLMRGF